MLKTSILIFFTVLVEVILLAIITILLLMGLAGVILPVIPGALFIGLAVALYLLIIKSEMGIISPRVHPHVQKFKYKFINSKINQKFMGLLKKIKQKKEKKVKEEILKNGLILLAFNFILVMLFFFGFVSVSLIVDFFNPPMLVYGFIPLLLIFVFSGVAAVVWFRFGQILGEIFNKNKVLNSSLVVIISYLPLLLLIMIFSSLIAANGGFSSELIAISFLGFLLLSVLASVFELTIVAIGTILKE